MSEKKMNKNNVFPMPLDLGIGKIPPQAIEFEEVVLGAMLLEKDAFTTVSEILKPEYFYREAHQYIFMAISNLFTKGQPIDMLTVKEELGFIGKLEEVGGAFYITQLTSRVASAAHVEYHAQIIYQKYLQREIIRLSGTLQTQAFDETVDVEELLENAEGYLFQLSQGSMKRDAVHITPVITDAIEKIKLASKRNDGLSGIPSGFSDLDKITSGWQASDLIIIAARPAMGKTAFVLSMARNMAVSYQQPVAVFSLEMSNIQLVNRLIISETELDSQKIKNGNLDDGEWDYLLTKVGNLENAPLYIDDTAGLSIFELRAKCRRLKKKHDIKAVIIDYLQLMNASGMKTGNRQEEVSMISRSLKGLAKELNIPIIALSQLNRSVEGRPNEGKRPQLSDLRESGAIEQDADIVVFIHRPEYYKILTDADGNSTIGMAELIIAKHRNGATGDVKLRFRSQVVKFENYNDDGFNVANPAENTRTLGSKMNNDISQSTFDNHADSFLIENEVRDYKF